jgi:glycosyltransferase involved in cell wall biosynthesis
VNGRIVVTQVLASGAGGGAQSSARNLVARLDHDRFDVQVVALSDGPAVRWLRAVGATTHVIDEPQDDAAQAALLELFRQRPPDIVHNHMYRAEVVGTRAALALADEGLPRPYVIGHVHSSRVRSEADKALMRRLTPEMDRLIAVSKAIAAKIQAEGRTGAPVELVYNGVDLEKYSQTEACCTLPEEYGFPEGTPLVGVVARLEPEKGHATLLDAWPAVLAKVPDARLLIVGEGSQRELLEAQAESLDLLGEECTADRCVGTRKARPGAKALFTGLRDDVPNVTAALDVAVLPSYREAQGLAILEAAALRRPVVATAVGGVPEMIESGKTGLLVAPHDAVALGNAIALVLTDHPLADMLARAGHDFVVANFSIESMVSAVTRIYEEGALVVARRSGATLTAA